MKQLTEEFFARHPDKVAQDLLGRVITTDLPGYEQKDSLIWRIGVYPEAASTTDKGIIQAPGTINISTKMGWPLIDICTDREGDYSCVTLFGYVEDMKKMKGSGKTSKFLNIDHSSKAVIQGAMLGKSQYIWISEEPLVKGFNIGEEYPSDKGPNCAVIYNIEDRLEHVL